jgi:RimJ/RimL family protein N-acetyltransferase
MWSAVRESVNELCEWMVWCKPDYSFEDSAAFVSRCAAEWNENKSYSFVIFDREDDSFLGSIGLNGINHTHKLANVGYWVRTEKTRRGVASAALGLIARFAFNHTELHRMEIVVPVRNYASLRAAEKAGATREGLLRSRVMLDGTPGDAVMYSIVKTDFARQA